MKYVAIILFALALLTYPILYLIEWFKQFIKSTKNERVY